jgi:hypothetical protein
MLHEQFLLTMVIFNNIRTTCLRTIREEISTQNYILLSGNIGQHRLVNVQINEESCAAHAAPEWNVLR